MRQRDVDNAPLGELGHVALDVRDGVAEVEAALDAVEDRHPAGGQGVIEVLRTAHNAMASTALVQPGQLRLHGFELSA